MRMKLAIIAAVMVVATACSGAAAPAPAQSTQADIVLNLDPYVKSKKNGLDQKSQDDIYKSYFDTNRFPQFGDQLLSFPFTKSLLITYQNDDILKEIGKSTPKTWDEFDAAARAAVKKGADGKTTRYGWAS